MTISCDVEHSYQRTIGWAVCVFNRIESRRRVGWKHKLSGTRFTTESFPYNDSLATNPEVSDETVMFR